jgi:hypothetical protein
MCSFWVTVDDREYSREDSECSPSRTALAHPSNVENFRKSRERRLRAKEAARNYDSARRQGSVQVTELDVLTGTDERLLAASKVPDWCLP